MTTARKSALGKGLGALLGTSTIKLDQLNSPAGTAAREVSFIPIARISPNPHQPRHTFSQESLEELAQSIRQHGVLQPVLLAPAKTKGDYVLVAGERRFRAAQLAQLNEIPALVSDVTDEEMLEIAIVENVQRDDLNPVEEALAYKQLSDTFGWSQEQIATRVGKNRTTVSNALRLLKLGDDALEDLRAGRLTPGHARALLSVEDSFRRAQLRKEILDKNLNVRDAERAASIQQKEAERAALALKKKLTKPERKLDTVALEERLLVHLGCRVRIQTRDGQSGSVEFPFRNLDELDRLLQALDLPD